MLPWIFERELDKTNDEMTRYSAQSYRISILEVGSDSWFKSFIFFLSSDNEIYQDRGLELIISNMKVVFESRHKKLVAEKLSEIDFDPIRDSALEILRLLK